jgi:SAM-dependent methyltransferase
MSKLLSLGRVFGIDAIKLIRSAAALPGFIRDYLTFRRLLLQSDDFRLGKLYPCLGENRDESGQASGHYFHQDILVARRIYENKPERHMDVGSSVSGFVAHVAVFRPIEVFDIRPLTTTCSNIIFRQLDIMNPIPAEYVQCCDSLSCLHTLEHFGLGRYGDSLNVSGHLVGFRNLASLVAPGGKFYLSVPIGPQRVEFNGHRVFSVPYMIKLVSEMFTIDRFSFVDDRGDLHENVALTSEAVENNFGCHFGCGIFELTKRGA